jgi:hypothetical protein
VCESQSRSEGRALAGSLLLSSFCVTPLPFLISASSNIAAVYYYEPYSEQRTKYN